MGGLEAEAAPHMNRVPGVQADALVPGALQLDGFDARDGEALAYPTGQVLIGGDRQVLVEI
jgi:hypothetical protein